MKTVQLKIEDDYIDLVIGMLQNLKKGVIQEIDIIKSSTQDKDDDIFAKTSGLLANQHIDPIKWQEDIRNEWDR
jgi:hypothetical protein